MFDSGAIKASILPKRFFDSFLWSVRDIKLIVRLQIGSDRLARGHEFLNSKSESDLLNGLNSQAGG